MRKMLLFLILFIFISCKTSNESEDFTIDLTAAYSDNINSYKIEPNGKVLVLFNKTYEKGRVFETEFTSFEMDSIQKIFKRIISMKCETLIGISSDGPKYFIVLKNSKGKISLAANTCENYKILDSLAYSIVKMVDKKERYEVYESFKGIVSPTDNSN